LTYEKKHEFNVGADIGFLHDRITLAADWFMRNGFDLLGKVYTTGIGGGAISKWANVASMKSQGYEFSLSTHNIVTRDFDWTTDFIFGKFTSKITDLKSKTQVIELVQSEGFPLEGYPTRALFSIPFVGLNEGGIPQIINQNGEVTNSDIYFQENTKLDFLIYEGPTDPTVTGSFGNIFSYKDFSLNLYITYSFGNVIRLDRAFFGAYSDLDAMPREFKNRWVAPGDELITNIPVIPSLRQVQNISDIFYAYNAYDYSNIRVAKGDFVRMKEISVNYNLPAKITEKLRLSNLSLKLQATNLFLIYADKKLNGQDPEFFNSGGVATPMPKQFTLTLRLGI
jgi:hypothetical protein